MTAVTRLECRWTDLYDEGGPGLLWRALGIPTPLLADGRRVAARREHGPLGVTAVLVTVLPGVTGCLVHVEEDFVEGPGLELPRPVRVLALERGNQRSLQLVASQLAGPTAKVPRPLPPPVRVLLAKRPRPPFQLPARPSLPIRSRPSFRVPPRPSSRVPPRPW